MWLLYCIMYEIHTNLTCAFFMKSMWNTKQLHEKYHFIWTSYEMIQGNCIWIITAAKHVNIVAFPFVVHYVISCYMGVELMENQLDQHSISFFFTMASAWQELTNIDDKILHSITVTSHEHHGISGNSIICSTAWIGLAWICLKATHILQDILAVNVQQLVKFTTKRTSELYITEL